MPFAVFSYLESCHFEIERGRECREKPDEEAGEGGESVQRRRNRDGRGERSSE